MKYKTPKRKPKNNVMFRIPDDIKEEFNKMVKDNNISGQALIESMVRYCLEVRAK